MARVERALWWLYRDLCELLVCPIFGHSSRCALRAGHRGACICARCVNGPVRIG